MSASFSMDSYIPKEIVAGDFPLVTEGGTIASGQNIKRGALLGKITSSGKLVLSLAAAEDGSETPYAVLADEEVNASAGDVGATWYLTGQFNAANLTIGTGHTAASVRAGLRSLGIFI